MQCMRRRDKKTTKSLSLAWSRPSTDLCQTEPISVYNWSVKCKSSKVGIGQFSIAFGVLQNNNASKSNMYIFPHYGEFNVR